MSRISTAAASCAAAVMASLQRSRSTTGDFTLTCEGQEIRAHLLVLSHGSDYFRGATASEWIEKGKNSMDIKECEPATLVATIDFLYGVELPEEFADLQGLLRLADMFFMEELREEVGRRLAVGISVDNYVERSKMADTLRSASLATACAKFIVNQGEGGTDWAAMERMPRVAAAVAKMATQVLWGARKSAVKERADFQTADEYFNYIKANTKEGTRVECRTVGDRGMWDRGMLGDQGTVDRNTGTHLQVSWDKGDTDTVSYIRVKLLASVDKKLFVAD